MDERGRRGLTVTTYNYGVETVRAIHPTQGDKAAPDGGLLYHLECRQLGHLIWPDWDTLCVKDRDEPLTEMIAKTIIKIAQTGVYNAAQLSALAIKELEIR